MEKLCNLAFARDTTHNSSHAEMVRQGLLQKKNEGVSNEQTSGVIVSKHAKSYDMISVKNNKAAILEPVWNMGCCL